MAFRFGSSDWADALQREINESSEYRNAASRWGVGFNGDIVFRFEADERLADTRVLLLRLAGGSCSECRFVPAGEAVEAGFTLGGPFTLWKSILERKTLAATAILTGKLEVQGEKMTLLKHTAANRALVHCTASVETSWD